LNRTTLFQVQSLFSRLQPQRELKLSLRSIDGAHRDVTVRADVRPRPPRSLAGMSLQDAGIEAIKAEARESGLMTARTSLIGDVLFCQFPSFLGTPDGIDALFREVKKHRAMILDLRGNPGGFTNVEARVVTNLFVNTVKYGEKVTRFGRSRETVPGSRGAFAGQLIVLIDARSASASELLARIVQLERRGTVIGDRSAGAVMEGILLVGTRDFGPNMLYTFSITHADLVMADGESLESKGVTPDEVLLPTAQDLALGRDPVLARAAKLAGLDIDPVAAGKLFPFEWK
jgi:C-terminal processing protease CtpA/Prc